MMLRFLYIFKDNQSKSQFINDIISITQSFINGFYSLRQISLVLLFVFFIVSVVGEQLFSGLFLLRCYNTDYGYPFNFNYNTLCSSSNDCIFLENQYNIPFQCLQSYKNPLFNLLNFDTIYNCIIVIFQLVTGQGITTVYIFLSKTFSDEFWA